MLRLGYNTNGFAHHRLKDAAEIIGEIGYTCLAVTIERDLLDPPDSRGFNAAAQQLQAIRRNTGLSLTLETGARFLLDPRWKHQPTLIGREQAGRRARIAFLKTAIDLAAACEAESVSLWSGAADDDAGEDALMLRLIDGLAPLVEHADTSGVRLSFEPEPGMFIDTMARFDEVKDTFMHDCFGLTLDIGHVICLDDGHVAKHIDRWKDILWNVHIEDMRPGVHEHLMFGEGQVDFASVFAALRRAEYVGPIHVELSRHSHDAVNTARKAFEFLSRFA